MATFNGKASYSHDVSSALARKRACNAITSATVVLACRHAPVPCTSDRHPPCYILRYPSSRAFRVTVRVCGSLQAASGVSPQISCASNVRAGWWRETPKFGIYVLSTPANPLLFFFFFSRKTCFWGKGIFWVLRRPKK